MSAGKFALTQGSDDGQLTGQAEARADLSKGLGLSGTGQPHDVQTRLLAGKAAASPTPKNSRAAARENALNAMPVAAVNADHHAIAAANTSRGP